LGLFLGVSVFSLAEMVEVFIEIFYFLKKWHDYKLYSCKLSSSFK
jgi:hypothetical protein